MPAWVKKAVDSWTSVAAVKEAHLFRPVNRGDLVCGDRMTTKWASCSTTGRICFSTELLDEPAAFREVVVVHELLHLLVPNHGNLFKSLMNAYLPGWEKRVAGRASRFCGMKV
jgi:predicted metal-dependent hydrolase